MISGLDVETPIGGIRPNLELETTLRIAEECPNVVGIKEASGKMKQILQLIAKRPQGFMVISGDDLLTLPLMAAFILMLLFGLVIANKINVMSTGDNLSKSLGVNPIRLRVVCFMVMSVATAGCVCYTGSIGFVGLVAPHIARLFVGSDNKILIPTAAVLGAVMVVVSDIAVRMIPGGLPVGTITALIGSPLFIYFLYRQRKNAAF